MPRDTLSPVWLMSSVWRHRGLFWQLALRDFQSRFKGSLLGVLWSVTNPLFLLATYSFVFVIVFRMRWSSTQGSDDFVLMLFVGLIVHSLLNECIVRSPIQLIAHSSYVKKVVFPLELLPFVTVSTAFVHFCIGLVLLIGAELWYDGHIHPTAALVPLILAPFAIVLAGISYFLSASGVFFRDLTQVVGQLSSVLMFGSPVLFPLEMVPEKYRLIIMFNPISLIVVQLREVVILGHMPNFEALGIYTVVAFFVFLAGFSWFQLTRKGFADVL